MRSWIWHSTCLLNGVDVWKLLLCLISKLCYTIGVVLPQLTALSLQLPVYVCISAITSVYWNRIVDCSQMYVHVCKYIHLYVHVSTCKWYSTVDGEVTLTEYDPSAAGLVQSVAERFAADLTLDSVLIDLVKKDKDLWL